jgi:hypothetical protein
MAIFLVYDHSNFNIRTEKDQACYKLGDIVEVFDDDKPCVIPPAEPFYLVKVTGLSRKDALRYIEPQWDDEDPQRPVMLRRRLYHIPIDLIPKSVKDKIRQDRYIEIPWSQARNYILDKIYLAGQ